MLLKSISLNLANTLPADSVYLPLSVDDAARLRALLAEDGEQIYLTITDGVFREYVLATNQSGTIVLGRGIDSEARKFPKGSCVFFENSIPVTKWLICNYECCQGDCPVEPVASAGSVLPPGKVGNAWEGSFVFSGDLPMAFAVTGMPGWMSATYSGNYVRLSGTPTAAATHSLSVAASNGNGANIAVAQGAVTITQE